ncbi:uncharacterized protein LOC141879852 [Acropora palmata]|uniref:uncharacterized protein LOC141879852 n=1 Tax=Acropora palmata TaxID=6131 RepID=UPI003D9FB2F3
MTFFKTRRDMFFQSLDQRLFSLDEPIILLEENMGQNLIAIVFELVGKTSLGKKKDLLELAEALHLIERFRHSQREKEEDHKDVDGKERLEVLKGLVCKESEVLRRWQVKRQNLVLNKLLGLNFHRE